MTGSSKLAQLSARHWLRFISLSAFGWMLMALLTSVTSQRAQTEGIGWTFWTEILPRFLVGYLPYMLITIFLYWSINRRIARDPALHVKILGPVYDTLVFAVFYIPFHITAWYGYRPGEPLSRFVELLGEVNPFFWLVDGIIYVAAYGMCYALVYMRLSRLQGQQAQDLQAANIRLELDLKGSQLQLLRGQLEPHFLFNALNSISALVRVEKPTLAVAAINQLSDLLRYSVESNQLELVPLEQELEFVRDYIALQQLRHAEKLRFELVDERVEGDQQVPPCLLQPLLENAIKHGLEAGGDHVDLKVNVRSSLDQLEVQVYNSLTPAAILRETRGMGVGLEGVRQRLRLQYGNSAVVLAGAVQNGYSVTIKLPLD